MDINKEREAFEAWVIENLAEGRSMSWEDWCWKAWQAAKAQAVPETKRFNLDEFLLMEEKLKHKGGVITADLDRFIAYAEMVLGKAKAQALPEGFTLVSQKDLLELTIAINAVDLATHTESKTNEVREMWQQVALKLMALGTTQEPK